MSNQEVLNHLEGVCRKLKLAKDEKEKIETSVNTIRSKLISSFFDDGLDEVRIFGSFDRGTMLSRSVDPETDVDMLIMFKERKKMEAQTYLTKLKKFAEDYYPRSEVYQDHPTIVVELNYITFELVPCIYTPESRSNYETFYIPQRNGDKVEWIKTKPDYYKNKIINDFPNTKETLIKSILLFKYWNFLNNFPYTTYQMEKFVINHFNHKEDLQYNLFNAIYELHLNNPKDEQNDANREAKLRKKNINLLLENDMEEYALMELSKLLPEIEI